MSDQEFGVEDPGAPNLHQGEGPPPPIEGADQVPDVPQVGWTEQQAGNFLAGILYSGLMVSFVFRRRRLPTAQEMVALAVQRQEIPQTTTAAIPILDRYLPIDGVGGMAAGGAALVAIPMELSVVVVKRFDYKVVDAATGRTIGVAPLLRRTPPPRDVTPEGQTETNGAAPNGGRPDEEPAAPAGGPTAAFHFDRRAAAVAEQSGDNLPGVGI